MDRSTQIVLGVALGIAIALILRAVQRRRETPRLGAPGVEVGGLSQPTPGIAGDAEPELLPEPEEDLLELVRQGRRVEAVKLYRERHGVGLADAVGALQGRRERTRTSPASRAPFALVWMLLLLLPLGPCLSPRLTAQWSGGHRAAVEALRACPAAIDALGPGIEGAWLGFDGYSIRGCGEGADAEGSLSVAGARARGRFSFAARQRDGAWHAQGTLRAGDAAISVPAACGAAAAPAAAARAEPPSCERLARCCAEASGRWTLETLCGSLDAVRETPFAADTCAQLHDAARRILAVDGAVPSACR